MSESCPACGSSRTVRLNQYARKTTGDVRATYLCRECGQEFDTAELLPKGHHGVYERKDGRR